MSEEQQRAGGWFCLCNGDCKKTEEPSPCLENTTSFTYDEIGNPLNWINNSTLTWQNGRQLASYSQNIGESSIATEYTYNAAGQRIAKQTGESVSQYIYDGSKLFKEIRPDGSYLLYYYDIAGQLFAFDYVNGETTARYFYQRNLTGEITGILDAAGVLVASYTYDAWGKILSIKDGSGNDVSGTAGHIANVNPFRYKGYYFDKETEFYFLQSRYYDTSVKRFLNADGSVSTGQGLLSTNMFAYCLNNPTNFFDPTGRNAWGNPMWDILDEIEYTLNRTSGGSYNPQISISSGNGGRGDGPSNGVKDTGESGPSPVLPPVLGTSLYGEPNTVITFPNGNQRFFGSDGRAQKDRDYSHPNHHPEFENPHEHDWTWDEEGNAHRGDAREAKEFSLWQTAFALGTIAVCGIAIVILVADDATGVGLANDFLIPGMVYTIGKSAEYAFGG